MPRKRFRATIERGGQGNAWSLVRIPIDTRPRTVRVPADLRQALAGNEQARQAFRSLARSHKMAYIEWVVEAKKPETRARRVAEAVRRLASGRSSR